MGLYNERRKLARTYERIQAFPHKENRNALLDYLTMLEINGRKPLRVAKVGTVLAQLAQMWGDKPFTEGTQHDVMRVMREFNQRNLSKQTISSYMVIIREFFRHIGNAEAVDWMRPPTEYNYKTEEDILTYDEVRRMIEAATHPRDRALIALLYESGGRE